MVGESEEEVGRDNQWDQEEDFVIDEEDQEEPGYPTLSEAFDRGNDQIQVEALWLQ